MLFDTNDRSVRINRISNEWWIPDEIEYLFVGAFVKFQRVFDVVVLWVAS